MQRTPRSTACTPALKQVMSFSVLVTICLLVAIQVHAQVDVSQARLSGTITDQSGAVLTAAAITLHSVERGSTRTVKTDVNGTYRLPLLQPGLYELTVSAPRFQTLTVQGITLTIGQSAVYDLQLSVGGVRAETTRRIAANLRRALTATNVPTTMRILQESEGAFTAPSRTHNWTTRADYQIVVRDNMTARFTLTMELVAEVTNLLNHTKVLRINDTVCGTTQQPGFINGCAPEFLTG